MSWAASLAMMLLFRLVLTLEKIANGSSVIFIFFKRIYRWMILIQAETEQKFRRSGFRDCHFF